MIPDVKRAFPLAILIFMICAAFTVMAPPVSADGGMITSEPMFVYESGQNAVIGWDGQKEKMCLSVNVFTEEDTRGFHVVPFLSEPEIEQGSLSMFENFSDIFYGFRDYDHDGMNYDSGPLSGDDEQKSVEVLREETIGEHDVTVIRVDSTENFKEEMTEIVEGMGIEIEDWPDELNDIITNYTERDMNFFTIDSYPLFRSERTVEPLVYTFESDVLIFPMEISSMLDGWSMVRLGLLTPPDVPLDMSVLFDNANSHLYDPYDHEYRFIDNDEVRLIDPCFEDMFPDGAFCNYFELDLPLPLLRGDIIVPRDERVDWMLLTGSEDDHHYPMLNDIRRIEGTELVAAIVLDYYGYEDKIVCLDGLSGEVMWEKYLYDNGYYDVGLNWFVDDLDGDGSKDMLISTSSHSTSIVCRSDPYSGEEEWSTEIVGDFRPERMFLMEGEGGQELAVLASPLKITAMDIETGELIEGYREEEYSYGSRMVLIDTDDILEYHFEGIGDGLIFEDTELAAWSPFFHNQGSLETYVNEFDGNTIWEREARLEISTRLNGSEYLLCTARNGSSHGDLEYIDPADGSTLIELSSSYWPEFWYYAALESWDMDGDGSEELVVVQNNFSGESKSCISCLDPYNDRRKWTMLISDDPIREESEVAKMDLVDLEGDGSCEIILQGEFMQPSSYYANSRVYYIKTDPREVNLHWYDTEVSSEYYDTDGDGVKELLLTGEYGDVMLYEPGSGELLTINDHLMEYEYDSEELIDFRIWDVNGDGAHDIVAYASSIRGGSSLFIIDGADHERHDIITVGGDICYSDLKGSDGDPFAVLYGGELIYGIELDEGSFLPRAPIEEEYRTLTVLAGDVPRNPPPGSYGDPEKEGFGVDSDIAAVLLVASISSIILGVVVIIGAFILMIRSGAKGESLFDYNDG
ncbi:MAG: DUF2330 domain-containing protein [Thermoplasmatota archaeon]